MQDYRNLMVLLVEPDQEQYAHLCEVATELGDGVEIEWVATFDEGLEALGRNEHQVCLVDADLDCYTGLELLQAANEMDSRVPIILLTEQSDHGAGLEGMRAGAADFLVKGQIGAHLLDRSIHYATERARMMETLQELANRDELTGLYNRREIGRYLAEEAERSRRYRNPLSLILIDIDNLDAIRTAHGREVSDAVLRWVAQVLRENVRNTDRPARFTDERLAVALPETTSSDAMIVAQRIRTMVGTHRAVVANAFRQAIEITVTLSLGVADIPGDAESDETLVAAAAQALAEAHSAGHNGAVRYAEVRPDTRFATW